MSCSGQRGPGALAPLVRLGAGGLVILGLVLVCAGRALADLGMQVSKLPLWKAFDQPFFSLDGSHVELFALLFLFMATVVVMSVSRRRQLTRHMVQIASLVIFFYIVFSCLGVFGMIRNTIHGIGLIGTVYTESFFWMSLPICVLAFSLTTGPFFCGWICPTGTIQELFAMAREQVVRIYRSFVRSEAPTTHALRPTKLNLALVGLFFIGFLYLVIRVSEERRLFLEDSSLYWAASILLINFLVLTGWADDVASRSLRWVSFVSILLSSVFKTIITSPVHFAFVDVLDPASAITTLILAVASLFIARSWCRYVCPWGQLMSLLHRFSRLKVRSVGECNQCGKCVEACRVAAVEPGHIRTAHCQFCFACVDACPQNGIEIVDDWLEQLRRPAVGR